MFVSAKFVHAGLCNHLSPGDSDLLAPLKLKKCQSYVKMRYAISTCTHPDDCFRLLS